MEQASRTHIRNLCPLSSSSEVDGDYRASYSALRDATHDRPRADDQHHAGIRRHAHAGSRAGQRTGGRTVAFEIFLSSL